MAPRLSHWGTFTDSFSWTWSLSGPSSAFVVFLVKLKPPVSKPAKPSTSRMIPAIRMGFMAYLLAGQTGRAAGSGSARAGPFESA